MDPSGDLGEPPVSVGFFFFSDEVALNRRGSHSLDLGDATGGGSQKAESIVFCWRTQSI